MGRFGGVRAGYTGSTIDTPPPKCQAIITSAHLAIEVSMFSFLAATRFWYILICDGPPGPTMTLLPLSLILFPGLCASAAGLSVRRDVMSFPVASDDLISQERSSEPASTILWRRTARLDRSTTIAVVVGTIGGVAMIATLFLGLLLVLRKRRERQKLQILASDQKDIVQFPDFLASVPGPFAPHSKERPYAYQNVPPRSPPQSHTLSLDNAESAWFVGEPTYSRKSPGRQPISRKTSLQELVPPSPAATRAPSRTAPRQEIIPDRNPNPAESLATRAPSRQKFREEFIPDRNPSPAPNSTTRTLPRKTSRQEIVPVGAPAENTTTRTPSRKRSRQEIIPASLTAGNLTTHSPSRKTSRPKITFDPNPSIIAENSTIRTPAASQPRTPRLEFEVTLISKPTKQGLPPTPRATRDPESVPERPPSPTGFRQLPQPESVFRRPRGSSLRGSRPNMIVTIPSPSHHVTSSEDIMGPVSRFSISPVAQSFPSRFNLTGLSPPSSARFTTRHTRRNGGFGSLSNLVRLDDYRLQ
ncbi:hypothetical protein MVEN_02445000 [Mycena venus]|uniref:Uncharacterized protein n=1 Tax=Mycena venus TaxID=2733690 RepID=A0A8H7CCG1_9AGAR|nr:hypothetical protein MVEN_02445000 [Mycena venus]